VTLTDAAVRAAVAEQWGIGDATVTPHHGGMNSATWFVEHAGRRWVAKSVPAAAARDFAGGLLVAGHLEQAGIRAGAPVPARDGRSVITVDGRPLALLSWVPGRPLEADDQPMIGATLASVHRRLVGFEVPSAHRFHWVDPGASHLDLRPWLRPAVTAAVEALDTAPMTWGLLHTDPSPEAFRLDGRRCGLIDWSWAMSGPLLYDLASAVMYVGGSERAEALIEAYLRAGVLPAAEVRQGLAAMLRFRFAVQADYFARRIVTNDLTGIGGPGDNERGLADARRLLGFPQVAAG
jgi:Ser/Thr protein kinase RdoA (MazF antagonist)